MLQASQKVRGPPIELRGVHGHLCDIMPKMASQLAVRLIRHASALNGHARKINAHGTVGLRSAHLVGLIKKDIFVYTRRSIEPSHLSGPNDQ